MVEVLDEIGAHVDAIEILDEGLAVCHLGEVLGIGVSALVYFGVKVGTVEILWAEYLMVFLVALVRFECGEIHQLHQII